MCFQNHLDGVAGHRVDRTDQTQAAGRQDAAGAEDAVVSRGRWLTCGYGLGWVAACHRGVWGGRISDVEGSRLSTPIFQTEDHGQILTCREA